jgi:hypothetical protein
MKRNLIQDWRPAAAIGLTAALFVPLLILGGPAFARSSAAAGQYGQSSSSQYQYRLRVCHRTRSRKHPWVVITIDIHAWAAHRRHGDTLLPCTPLPGPLSAPAPTASFSQTKGNKNKDKGKSDANGNGKSNGHESEGNAPGGQEHGRAGGHGRG